jgi:DNA polymerase III alpha subunit
MRLDQFSNPVFNEQDIFEALYQGQTLSPAMIVESSTDIQNMEETSGFKFTAPYPDNLEITQSEYDSACQSNWLMPDEYKTLDIETWIWTQTPPWDPQHTRVSEELQAYKARNMLDLLRWLKYFVDTCSKENIVWGLGRGSSVASYVLFLIGVHNIDSIKYNLDWQEFLR